MKTLVMSGLSFEQRVGSKKVTEKNLHALFTFSFPINITTNNITTNNVNFLSFDNDDMKPSKRQVSLISLIFVLKSQSPFLTTRLLSSKRYLGDYFDEYFLSFV